MSENFQDVYEAILDDVWGDMVVGIVPNDPMVVGSGITMVTMPVDPTTLDAISMLPDDLQLKVAGRMAYDAVKFVRSSVTPDFDGDSEWQGE